MVATTLKIDATLLARMDVLRDELQIPRSLIIARALKKYLEEREPEEI
jgi:predicted transcriptional regulator